jgi:uncharacterized protein (DUF3084 family)
MERLRASNEEEVQRERNAKQEAIATAERRLTELESQAEAAEKRVEEAERRAQAAGAGGDTGARAREGAAAWLRGQIEAIREEARRR